MVAYPYYAIGALSLNDATGRWNEKPETQIIPAFPGIESTVISLPGVPGNIPGPIASTQPSTVALTLYVWATEGGVIPDDHDARVAAIATNAEALYRGIQGAAAAYGGGASVPLTRFYSATDSRTAYGRFEASAEPVMDDAANYATITLLFNIPSGTWRKPAVTTPELSVGSVGMTQFQDSVGPIPDSRVVLIGPFTSATVTNSGGIGFKLNLAVAAGEWTVVDAAKWTYRAPATGTPLPTATANLTAAMQAVGPPLGSALVLVPSSTSLPINVSMTGSSSASKFIVRAQPAYF